MEFKRIVCQNNGKSGRGICGATLFAVPCPSFDFYCEVYCKSCKAIIKVSFDGVGNCLQEVTKDKKKCGIYPSLSKGEYEHSVTASDEQ